ncbi:hypothetical protein Trydic_g333 [Trypoxylus dichotomus]
MGFCLAARRNGNLILPVPLTVINTLDVEEVPEDDDLTTHTLERLSSAATCLVASVEYTHGQQIYRKDPCEFCLCLDGEMFCWWQDCPPTLEGPCRDRGPFSPCLNGAKSKSETTSKPKTKTSSATRSSQPKQSSTSSTSSTTSTETSSSSASVQNAIVTSTVAASTTTKSAPKICVVMGREYKIGDKLPHDTGNCVECVCGNGGQITCSPHQCAPLGDDINDYRPPGPRSPLSDVF